MGKLTQFLTDMDYEDVVVFADDEFESAFIGMSTDDRAIYDYDKMVEWYVDKYECSCEEAMDWLDYNTIRSLPYVGGAKSNNTLQNVRMGGAN